MAWRCGAKELGDGIKTQAGREAETERGRWRTEQFSKWSMGHTTDIVVALSKRGGGEDRRGEERRRGGSKRGGRWGGGVRKRRRDGNWSITTVSGSK